MDFRQQKILEAIIEAFIQDALPVGSKHLSQKYDFKLSPATIRNEMAKLEKEGYIEQPYTSAGRVPTSRAYRMLVDQIKDEKKVMVKAMKDLQQAQQKYHLQKTKEKLYETVSVLSEVTQNISFATLPDKRGFFYFGISNMLKKPEFMADPAKSTQVIEMLEKGLRDLISELEMNDEGTVYIGEENLLPQFQSCSLLAFPYAYKGFHGVIGLLGPTRMDYAYNLAALKAAVQLIVN